MPVLLRHFVRTRLAGAIFRLRLRQARRGRPQRLEQIFTVLLSGIEHGRRNMNVLTLDLWEDGLLLRGCRWLGKDGG